MESDKDIEILRDLVRFPVSSTIGFYNPNNKIERLKNITSNLHLMPLPNNAGIEELMTFVNIARTSIIFCLDGTHESALV